MLQYHQVVLPAWHAHEQHAGLSLLEDHEILKSRGTYYSLKWTHTCTFKTVCSPLLWLSNKQAMNLLSTWPNTYTRNHIHHSHSFSHIYLDSWKHLLWKPVSIYDTMHFNLVLISITNLEDSLSVEDIRTWIIKKLLLFTQFLMRGARTGTLYTFSASSRIQFLTAYSSSNSMLWDWLPGPRVRYSNVGDNIITRWWGFCMPVPSLCYCPHWTLSLVNLPPPLPEKLDSSILSKCHWTTCCLPPHSHE